MAMEIARPIGTDRPVMVTWHVPAPVADVAGQPGRSGFAWFLGTGRSDVFVHLLRRALAIPARSEVRG